MTILEQAAPAVEKDLARKQYELDNADSIRKQKEEAWHRKRHEQAVAGFHKAIAKAGLKLEYDEADIVDPDGDGRLVYLEIGEGLVFAITWFRDAMSPSCHPQVSFWCPGCGNVPLGANVACACVQGWSGQRPLFFFAEPLERPAELPRLIEKAKIARAQHEQYHAACVGP